MSFPLIKENSVLLFQGDSITDAGRNRMASGPTSGGDLGFGYARLISDRLLIDYPELKSRFYNRGISGDRIRDMAMRWDQDAIQIKPDLISIMIGVNDTWNYVELGLGSDPEDYLQVFRKILQDTRRHLSETRLVLCEPFLLHTGGVTEVWLDDIRERQEIVRSLAKEHQGVVVPFQSSLDEAANDIPAHKLLNDGVHPTEQGHRILAECWLRTVLS